VGDIHLYVTVNKDKKGVEREIFVKATCGFQGWCDALAVVISMALQHGVKFEDIMRKLRGMRFQPDAIGVNSIPDGIARAYGVGMRKDGDEI